MIAYCWANGLIEFGPRVPDGAIEIARGRGDDLVRTNIIATARHGKRMPDWAKTVRTAEVEEAALLVPGVPEAPDQHRAHVALELFLLWLKQRECKGFRVAVQPRNPFDYDLCGTPVSSLSVDDRCRAVAGFDQVACMSALLVPGLQATVRTAIERRLRKLLKAEVVA